MLFRSMSSDELIEKAEILKEFTYERDGESCPAFDLWRKMMSYEAFMSQNKKKKPNVKYAASSDFIDEEGNPLEWELKTLSAKKMQEVRRQCYKTVQSGKGKTARELDPETFLLKLTTACVVVPDLDNADLQNSYGVMTPEELIGLMIDGGEFDQLAAKVQEISGYTKPEEDIETVKN